MFFGEVVFCRKSLVSAPAHVAVARRGCPTRMTQGGVENGVGLHWFPDARGEGNRWGRCFLNLVRALIQRFQVARTFT